MLEVALIWWLTMGEGSTFVNNRTIKIVESCESDTWFAMGGLFHRIVNVLIII